MTSLNQGFVREFNLDETIDSFKAINNLAKGSITSDLVVFANNSENITRLIFDRFNANSSVFKEPLADGTTFLQSDKIGTFGNGDRVRIKTIDKILNAQYNTVTDTLFLTLEEPHGINFGGGVVYIKLQGTYFDGPATNTLNDIFYVAQSGGGGNQLLLFDIGFDSVTGGVGTFAPNFNNVNRYPYIESFSLPLPTLASGSPLAYDQIYYIAFSNAINKFRVGRNFSRTSLINQIDFGSLNKNIVFERINECTQENLLNLSRPVFEDDTYTYFNGVLGRSFGENFTTLESYLDSANYFKIKKYLTSSNNVFNETELSFEGNLLSSDADTFNTLPSNLSDSVTSPGIFILDKDSSSTSNIVKIRAYSDNTQPWELTGGTTLEYAVLRDKITDNRFSLTTQEMQIGNLIMADKSASGMIELDGMQNITLVSSPTIPASDPSKLKFTHKMPILVNGEIYSLCLSTSST
jgi:hypothetical protein